MNGEGVNGNMDVLLVDKSSKCHKVVMACLEDALSYRGKAGRHAIFWRRWELLGVKYSVRRNRQLADALPNNFGRYDGIEPFLNLSGATRNANRTTAPLTSYVAEYVCVVVKINIPHLAAFGSSRPSNRNHLRFKTLMLEPQIINHSRIVAVHTSKYRRLPRLFAQQRRVINNLRGICHSVSVDAMCGCVADLCAAHRTRTHWIHTKRHPISGIEILTIRAHIERVCGVNWIWRHTKGFRTRQWQCHKTLAFAKAIIHDI